MRKLTSNPIRSLTAKKVLLKNMTHVVLNYRNVKEMATIMALAISLQDMKTKIGKTLTP